MTDHPAAAVAGSTAPPVARLEPNAIGAAQNTIIGMASSAPAATVGLTLEGLAAATAYGSGPILLLTAIPMLIIANAYRRCNSRSPFFRIARESEGTGTHRQAVPR